MKTFANLLLGFLFLTNLSFIMALDSGSFHPIETIRMRGSLQHDNLGYSVSRAGDVNKDGYDDIIIGAHNYANGKGAVFVIYGGEISSFPNLDLDSSDLDPLTTGFMITGDTASDYFGASVSSAGDINNDGYDDIIFGAFVKNGLKGAAYVVYGGPQSSMSHLDFSTVTLDPLTTGFRITGDTPFDSLGVSVSSAGDINNDGYDDIIIGAYGKNGFAGAAYVVYGRKKSEMSHLDLSTVTLNPLTTVFMVKENLFSSLGKSVSCAGDINNDGYDDIIIGAPDRAMVYVIYGGEKSSFLNLDFSTQPLNPLRTGFKITGSTGDGLGWSLNRAGDINNDGYDDIIVGTYSQTVGTIGAAYVIYGGEKQSMSNIILSSTPLNPLTTGFRISGSAEEDLFGYSVNSAGDVNKDGYDDIIIGAYGKGEAYVVYGGKKSNLPNLDLKTTTLDPLTTGFSVVQASPGDQLGVSVSSGDVNKDGYSDLIIGAWGENTYTGAAYTIFSHCPENCEICSAYNYCKTCSAPYFAYLGQCVTTCPIQKFRKGNECQNCPAGCSECTSLLSCQACHDGYTLSESKCMKDNGGAKAAAGVFEGTSIVGSSLASGSSLPLNFGLVAKILRNIKYMRLPVSNELQETFVSWKVGTGFLSAPKSWSSKYSSKNLPNVFSRYDLPSAFLMNFWKPFVMALIGIAIFGIFKLIEVSMSNNKKSMAYNISKQVHNAASNFALTQFYSNLDDVLFYFVLEMKSTDFETGFRICSSLLAIVLLLVGVIFIGLHSKLIAKYQNMKGKGSPTELENKYENINLIFKDFKDTDPLIQSFLMINVIRSVLSSLIFATLFEYPIIQISFLFVLNILMLTYLWNKKSFKEFTNTCGQIFCELVLFIANICVFLLALFDHADFYPITAIENLSKCIIALNFILLFGSALLMLVNLGKIVYQSYLEKKKAQQQPSLSGEKIFNLAKFNRPDSGLPQSNQILSTSSGILNESQASSQSGPYQNNALKTHGENNDNNFHKEDRNLRHHQGISYNNNSSLQKHKRNQKPIEAFENTSSNTEKNHSNPSPKILLPRSRLMRNREATKVRIAQAFRMGADSSYGSPESRIQDSSFHSRMALNEDEMVTNQDFSLITLDSVAESPPLRPRRRAGTMKK